MTDDERRDLRNEIEQKITAALDVAESGWYVVRGAIDAVGVEVTTCPICNIAMVESGGNNIDDGGTPQGRFPSHLLDRPAFLIDPSQGGFASIELGVCMALLALLVALFIYLPVVVVSRLPHPYEVASARGVPFLASGEVQFCRRSVPVYLGIVFAREPSAMRFTEAVYVIGVSDHVDSPLTGDALRAFNILGWPIHLPATSVALIATDRHTEWREPLRVVRGTGWKRLIADEGADQYLSRGGRSATDVLQDDLYVKATVGGSVDVRLNVNWIESQSGPTMQHAQISSLASHRRLSIQRSSFRGVLGSAGSDRVGQESPSGDQRGYSSEERQDPLRPGGWRKWVALLRFVVGCTLFSCGLLRAYRLDLDCKRSQLFYSFLLTLSGSIVLLAFRWPR